MDSIIRAQADKKHTSLLIGKILDSHVIRDNYHFGEPSYLQSFDVANFENNSHHTEQVVDPLDDYYFINFESLMKRIFDYSKLNKAAQKYIRLQIQRDIDYRVKNDPASQGSFEETADTAPEIKLLSMHRVAHNLWLKGQKVMAEQLAKLAYQIFDSYISPAAYLACPISIDHGIGINIQPDTVIKPYVLILNGVTLGKDGSSPVIESRSVLCRDVCIHGNMHITGLTKPRVIVTNESINHV